MSATPFAPDTGAALAAPHVALPVSRQPQAMADTEAGTVDANFAEDGLFRENISGVDRILATAVQGDGKIIAVGRAGGDFAAARIDASGKLDNTFGEGGIRRIAMIGTSEARDVAIDPARGIVLVGAVNNLRDVGIARLTFAGDLDTTFASGGRFVHNAFGDGAANAVRIVGDGGLLVAGNGGDAFVIYKLAVNGTLDPTFGGGTGIVRQFIAGKSEARDLAIQPDGRIVVVGAANNKADFGVLRLHPAGAVDTSFGSSGWLTKNISSRDEAEAVVVDEQSRIVVAGVADDHFAVVRWLSNGDLDSSFMGDKFGLEAGVVRFPVLGDAHAYDMALQQDGKIVVVGAAGNEDDIGVVRLTEEGVHDPTFADEGSFVKNISGHDTAYSVEIDADGHFIVAGSGGDDFAMVRLFSDQPDDPDDDDDGTDPGDNEDDPQDDEPGDNHNDEADDDTEDEPEDEPEDEKDDTPDGGGTDKGDGNGGGGHDGKGSCDPSYFDGIRDRVLHKTTRENETATIPLCELVLEAVASGSPDEIVEIDPKSEQGGLLTVDGDAVLYSPPQTFVGSDRFYFSFRRLKDDARVRARVDVLVTDGLHTMPTWARLEHASVIVEGTAEDDEISLRQTRKGLLINRNGDEWLLKISRGRGPTGGWRIASATVYGGDGNDRIRATTDMRVVFHGGSGNDKLDGSRGRDQLYGGEGDDHLSGFGGADVMNGGSGHDRLWGGRGNDSLFGEVGDDILSGGSGRDSLDGGEGNDQLKGDTHADIIFGGVGDDTIWGGGGSDRLFGDAGNDLLLGQSGDDVLFGQDGDDRLKGGTGNDILFGRAGSDELDGGSGADRLVGGLGDDRLRSRDSRKGNDTLIGSLGTDFFDAPAQEIVDPD